MSGKRTTLDAVAQELDEMMERARFALQTIVSAIEANPGRGQARRFVSYLAGMNNGSGHRFDLTDLRIMDMDLAKACINSLSYGRLGRAEVHTHCQAAADR